MILAEKMKCLIPIALVAVAYCEIKEEQNILVVTTDNWDEAVRNDSIVFVYFCKVFLFKELFEMASVLVSVNWACLLF